MDVKHEISEYQRNIDCCCKFCNKKYSNPSRARWHERKCIKNPDRVKNYDFDFRSMAPSRNESERSRYNNNVFSVSIYPYQKTMIDDAVNRGISINCTEFVRHAIIDALIHENVANMIASFIDTIHEGTASTFTLYITPSIIDTIKQIAREHETTQSFFTRACIERFSRTVSSIKLVL